jgi:hypothetical protein
MEEGAGNGMLKSQDSGVPETRPSIRSGGDITSAESPRTRAVPFEFKCGRRPAGMAMDE